MDFLLKRSDIPTMKTMNLLHLFKLFTSTDICPRKAHTLTFMNFEDGRHFQDGWHEVTSCVGITVQLLLAAICILNKFFKVCTWPCIEVLLFCYITNVLVTYVFYNNNFFSKDTTHQRQVSNKIVLKGHVPSCLWSVVFLYPPHEKYKYLLTNCQQEGKTLFSGGLTFVFCICQEFLFVYH